MTTVLLRGVLCQDSVCWCVDAAGQTLSTRGWALTVTATKSPWPQLRLSKMYQSLNNSTIIINYSTFGCMEYYGAVWSSMERSPKRTLLHSVLLYSKINQFRAPEVQDAEVLTLDIFGYLWIRSYQCIQFQSNAERLFFDATQDSDLLAASFMRLQQAVAECLRLILLLPGQARSLKIFNIRGWIGS